MKKFQSRWGLIQRLSSQRRKLAELEVMRARAAVSQIAEQERALQQSLVADAHEFAGLAHGPVPAHLLVACRLVTHQHADQLVALQAERVKRQHELGDVITTWRQRSVEVDQADQLTQQEREHYDAELLALEQLEIDEHSLALRRSRDTRSEGLS